MLRKQERLTSQMKRLSNGLIDLGGGSTPRPNEAKHVLLNSTGAPKINLDSSKFKMLIKKFEDLGKLDLQDFNSTAEMCAFLDFYNGTVKAAKQSEYDKQITDINEYYYKLWIRAIDSMR